LVALIISASTDVSCRGSAEITGGGPSGAEGSSQAAKRASGRAATNVHLRSSTVPPGGLKRLHLADTRDLEAPQIASGLINREW
jgi:hypothetical protein